MVKWTQDNQNITGLIPNYISNGVAILQYADHTILCLQDDEEMARNMKLMLYIFEDMSGLKINFNKSEVIMITEDGEKSYAYSEVFNCAIGSWPIKYLGVPVAGSRLHIQDWLPLDEKILKRLDGWMGGTMSIGGRTTLSKLA